VSDRPTIKDVAEVAPPVQRPLEVLAARFGFESFRGVLEQVVDALL
jgi:hypothetical protein